MNLDHDLMSSSDIARAAGVDLSTVSNWRRRFAESFPPAVADVDGGKRARFDRAAVKKWLADNPQLGASNKLASRDLFAVLDSLRGEMGMAEAVDLVGATFVLAKALASNISAGTDLYRAWREQQRDITAEVRVLVDKVQWDRIKPDKLHDVFRVVEGLGEPAGAYRALLAQQSGRFGDLSEHATPDLLAQFLLALAPSSEGTVFDPAAGTGGLIFSAIAAGKARRGVGVEISESVATVGRRLAYLEARTAVTFYQADAVLDDPVVDLRADLVLCDPPLGVKLPGYSQAPVWQYGQPKSSNMDLGWLQICLRHLAKDGTALAVTTPVALYGRDRPSVEIRSAMVRDGVVRAIVLLPGRTRSNTAIPLAVWVLGNPAPERQEMLLVDASNFEHSELTADGPISAVVNGWLSDRLIALDSSFAVAVPVRELLTPEVNLLPTRFVSTTDEERSAQDWFETVESKIAVARATLAEVAGRDLPIEVEVVETNPEIVSIQELVQAGTIRLLRGRHWVQEEEGDDESKGPRILNPRALRDQDFEPQRAADKPSSWAATVHPGDVVIVPSADALHTEVWTQDGWVPGSYVDVIRILDETLDPSYLAAAITHPRNKRLIVASAVRAKVELKELRVPLLRIEAQKRFARAHELLVAREAELTRSLDAIVKLRKTLAEGFASAAIDVRTHDR